jgi:butyrate kinase
MNTRRILVINPGSTSTKLSYFAGDVEAARGRIEHPMDELGSFPDIPSQLEYRLGIVEGFIKTNGIEEKKLDAIAARGGLMKPVRSGTYRINQAMVDDLVRSKGRWGREHASNLGAMLARRLSEKLGVPAFTSDPVTVDEMSEVARVSGVPEIKRKSHLHALNIKAVLGRACRDLGVEVSVSGFVIAHVGGGVSIAAVKGGAIVDVNNALLGMGPFGPARAGALPIGDLVEMAFSGRYDREGLERKLVYESGLTGYLGTSDVREVERRVLSGDALADTVYRAMAYQTSKEIGAMAAALSGRVDAVLLTGGVANSSMFTDMLAAMVAFIAPVRVYPGEFEMEALAEHARAVLAGEEEVLEYE